MDVVCMIWFVSDYHFNHFNIIRYCGRPVTTSKEMDETIISRHNEVVKPDDEVYFLGDFQFSNIASFYLPRMNGKFTFVKGNHDRLKPFRGPRYLFENIDDYKILMLHWVNYVQEFNSLSEKADIIICGHHHEKGKLLIWEDKILLNVSVDMWNYYPVNLETVVKTIEEKNPDDIKIIK